MQPHSNIQVVPVEVYVDPGAEDAERTIGYIYEALKSSCRNLRAGGVVIVIRDPDDPDRIVGMGSAGTLSKEFQKRFNDLFDKLDERPPLAS